MARAIRFIKPSESLALALLAASLLASAAPANADKIVRLLRPVVGCADKAELAHFPSALAGTGADKALSPVDRNLRCVRLDPGSIRIDRVDGSFACVHSARYSCLWVRAEEIGVPIHNDGAF